MTEAPAATLGNYLREARRAAGLNQTDLARLLGTAQHVVSAYERNKRVPNGPMLALLARHLPGVDPVVLLSLISGAE